MPNTVRISVQKVGDLKLQGTNALGRSILMDAPVPHGGSDEGVRPIEALLMSLAGCASVDVLAILAKQRQVVEDFNVSIEGDRIDAVPAIFEAIRVHFAVKGIVNSQKLSEAVQLSAEKYCSVASMLRNGGIPITWTSEVVHDNTAH